MRRRRGWWAWILFLVALAGGAVALIVHFARSELGHNDQLASTISVLVAILALGCAVIPEVRRSTGARERAGATEPLVLEELHDKAAALCAVIENFWSQEAADRGLRGPRPINVHWRTTTREVLGDVRDLLGADLTVSPTRLRAEGSLGDALDRFLGLRRRRLVILGGAGSGKTSFAVVLLLGIAGRRGREEPVPYLVPVASWNPRRERLRVWLIRRLAAEHYDGDPHIPAALVAAGLILPVLDGIDEIARELQPHAIQRIGAELDAAAPMIITSLTDEYERAVARPGTALESAVVVELQPLTTEQIIEHLRQDGTALPHWLPVLRSITADPAGAIAAAFSTPLAVSLARAIYAEPARSPDELVRLAAEASPGAIEDQILDAVIPVAFASDRQEDTTPSWSVDQATVAFTFIAKVLSRSGVPTIEWWRLNAAVPRVVTGLVIAVAGALMVSLTGLRLPQGWPMLAAFVGLVGGIAAALAENPAPVAGEIRVRGRWPHLAGHLGRSLAGSIGLSILMSLPLGILFAGEYAIARDPDVSRWVAEGTTWAGYGPSLVVGAAVGIVTGCIAGAVAAMIVGVARGMRHGARACLSVASWIFVGICTIITLSLHEVPARQSLVEGLDVAPEPQTTPLGGGVVREFADAFTTTEVSEDIVWHLFFTLPLVAATFGVLGLIFGVVAATRAAARAPIDVRRIASPLATWRADRSAAATQVLAVFIAVGVTWLSITAVLSEGRPDVVGVLLFALGCGLYSVCFTAWFRFQLARAYFSVVHGLPWDLLGLLEAGHQRQVLRQVGAGYQFRHGKLQQRLARPDGQAARS